jgi:hypothetical protein
MPKHSVRQKFAADVNQLEEYVFGKPPTDKRAERLDRSQVARRHRAEVKELKLRKAIKERAKP